MLMLLPPSMSTLSSVYPPTYVETTRARAAGLSTTRGWSSLVQVIGCFDQLSHLGQAGSVVTTMAALRCRFLSLRQLLVTTRKMLIGRNALCGALKLGCSTKIFLWPMGHPAPQKYRHFCGACG